MTVPAASTLFRSAPARRGFTRRQVILGGLAAGSVTAGGTAAYGASEAVRLVVTDYRLALPSWPAGRRMTIAVITDLHAGGPNMGLARVRDIAEKTQELACDLVVLLGDYFATHRFVTERVPHASWAAELGRLSARLGVWAILGNHDWWHDVAGTRGALRSVNIPVLENDAVLLGEGSERLWLAGLGDQLAYRIGYGRYRGIDDLPRTMAQIATEDPVILLVHEPDIFPRVPSRVALTLAGHTHGGQVRLPLVWPAFVPSKYGSRYAYGHIVEENRHMVVSGGLGTSLAPIRIGVPPEIVRITLGG